METDRLELSFVLLQIKTITKLSDGPSDLYSIFILVHY